MDFVGLFKLETILNTSYHSILVPRAPQNIKFEMIHFDKLLDMKPTLPLSTQSTAGAVKLGAKAPLPSAKPNTPSAFPASATPPAAAPGAASAKKKWYEKLGQSVDKLNSALDSIEQVSTRIEVAVSGNPLPPKTPAAIPAKPSAPVASPTRTTNVASPPLISQTPRIASSATLPASPVKTILTSRPATTPQASLRTSQIAPPDNAAVSAAQPLHYQAPPAAQGHYPPPTRIPVQQRCISRPIRW